MNRREQRIVDTLFALGRDHECVSRARIVSAIVIKNKIVSFGFNQYKTHPLQNKFKKNPHAVYLHAEVDAIKNACKAVGVDELQKATLYITRVKFDQERKTPSLGYVAPCEGCMRCIVNFGVKKVVYSTESGYECI